MTYHCAVSKCSNGSYKILRWKQEHCAIHGSKKGNEGCSRDIEFNLIPFPTAKSDRETRARWKALINREDPKKKGKLWSPSKYSRVCTKHFVDGEPTPTNPDPTIDLSYPDAIRKVKLISKNSSRRRKLDLKENSEPVAAKCPKKAETVHAERDEIPVPQEDCVLNEEVITEEQMTPNHEKQPNSNLAIILFHVRVLFSFISFLLSTCTRLSKEVKTLKRENEMLKKKIS